jgi:polyphenol oxidase
MNLLKYCIVPGWPTPANVKALQTTRKGGTSRPPFDSLNLGDHVSDDPLSVARNRMLLEPLLPSEPVWLKQVHGTNVIDAGQASCLPTGDASFTTHKGAVCVVMTADCLPILLCDEAGSIVAAVHAGWRGLCAGVVEETVRAMNRPPPSLMAWLGPAIGPTAFEVGEEVREAFVAAQPEAARAFVPAPANSAKYYADIYALGRQRLMALGISKIYGGDFCTYNDRERFYSHRRDNVTGRMGTFVWLT